MMSYTIFPRINLGTSGSSLSKFIDKEIPKYPKHCTFISDLKRKYPIILRKCYYLTRRVFRNRLRMLI